MTFFLLLHRPIVFPGTQYHFSSFLTHDFDLEFNPCKQIKEQTHNQWWQMHSIHVNLLAQYPASALTYAVAIAHWTDRLNLWDSLHFLPHPFWQACARTFSATWAYTSPRASTSASQKVEPCSPLGSASTNAWACACATLLANALPSATAYPQAYPCPLHCTLTWEVTRTWATALAWEAAYASSEFFWQFLLANHSFASLENWPKALERAYRTHEKQEDN